MFKRPLYIKGSIKECKYYIMAQPNSISIHNDMHVYAALHSCHTQPSDVKTL